MTSRAGVAHESGGAPVPGAWQGIGPPNLPGSRAPTGTLVSVLDGRDELPGAGVPRTWLYSACPVRSASC